MVASAVGVRRHFHARLIVGLLFAFLGFVTTDSFAFERPTRPFAPDWGMRSGWNVFTNKGCVKCHAIRGFGGTVGPDLARIEAGESFYDIGAAMWNHLPRMATAMTRVGTELPILTPQELADLIAFLFTAQYYDPLGDASLGRALFESKGCKNCHQLGGNGGRRGPSLDYLKRVNSPVLVAAAMWNHGVDMSSAMDAEGMERPTFEGRELLDLIAYIISAADDGRPTPPVTPGTPDRGQELFTEKKCVVCHSVAGGGGKIGPDLGQPRHHLSVTEFAGLMWNHGGAMWLRMRQQKIEIPRLTGQDMADILAYLYTSRYFSEGGSVARGRRNIQTKGCLNCHSVRGRGGHISVDFAKSRVVHSSPALIAGMWNHGGEMQRRASEHANTWPSLTGQALADIAAYLSWLSSPDRMRPR